MATMSRGGESVLLALHRWIGLSVALVLVIVGLTGAILPFAGELNRFAAPSLWRVAPPDPGAAILSGIEIKERVEQQTGGNVSFIRLSPDPGYALAVFVEPRPGGPVLDYSELITDPYSGTIRRRLRYGDLSEGMVNIIPFLVKLHYSLAAGRWGIFAFGVVALIWCAECLLGLCLTLPRGTSRAYVESAGWLRRWSRAWRIRGDQGGVRLHDMHRALGLWLLPVMLVFGWSAVAFNLQEVHAPVQRLFGGQGLYAPVTNVNPSAGRSLTPAQAVERGQALMREAAVLSGFSIEEPYAISWNPFAHAIGYYARTSLDGPTDQGATAVWFDESSGQFLEFRHPYGNTKADAFDKATRMLHTASLFGLPYKIFVSLVGILVATMAIAGCVLWLRRLAGTSRKRPDIARGLAPGARS